MTSPLSFSFLDTQQPPLPKPDTNQGLFTGQQFNMNNPWSPKLYVLPDATEYSKHFYAPTHIGYDRTGNNQNMNKC
jgi:hypothetical protein